MPTLIEEPMLFNYPGLTWLDLLGLHHFQPPAAQGFRAVQVSPPSEHAQGLPLGWVQSGRWKHQLQCRMHRSLFIFFLGSSRFVHRPWPRSVKRWTFQRLGYLMLVFKSGVWLRLLKPTVVISPVLTAAEAQATQLKIMCGHLAQSWG